MGQAMDQVEGSLLAARYRILRRLGHGGMSTVYLARDEHFPHVERRCAIKIMRASDDPVLAQLQKAAFEREASLLATLRHPAIPEVYDFFVEDGRCCLVLEFIEGEDLERYLDRIGAPVAESLLIDWALQILDVLDFLHTRQPHPIIFRDLKPSNIMLRETGSLALIDFGIARLFQPDVRGTMIGTEGYAPPEQYRGIVDPRGDLYALGATLYHLATGVDPRNEPPFSLPHRPPRTVNPTLSVDFERVILRALAYDPRERFPSAAAMAAALHALQATPVTSRSRRTSTVTQAARFAPSRTGDEQSEVLWTVRTGDEIRGSPIFMEDLVVFGSYDGRFYAVERHSGEVRWQFATHRGIATTPAPYRGTIIGGSDDGAVYCLDAADGSLRWRYRTAGPVRSSPVLVGTLVVFGSDDGFLYALDAATGTAVWRRQARGPVRATPVPLADAVVAAADDGSLTRRAVHDGQLHWRQRLDAPIWGKPLATERTVIVATVGGTVACFDTADGSLRWRHQFPDAFVAAPVIINGLLMLAGNAGHVFACATESGEQVWQLTLHQRIASTPVPFGTTILLATGKGQLVCIASTGEIIDRLELGSGIVATPLVEKHLIYIGCLDGTFSVVAWDRERTQ